MFFGQNGTFCQVYGVTTLVLYTYLFENMISSSASEFCVVSDDIIAVEEISYRPRAEWSSIC